MRALALLFVATVAAAQPAVVTCGPAQATCGPAQVLGVTTTGVAAPSWVPSTLAAWMMDEAAGNARVNLQGTSSRNLVEQGGAIANSTVTKMEGTAAASPTNVQSFSSNDAALWGLAPPFTCMAWARYTGADTGTYPAVIKSANTPGSNGMKLAYDNHARNYFVQTSAAVVGTAAVPVNTFAHVAVTDSGTTLAIYANGGVSSSTAAGAYVVSGGTWVVGSDESGGYPGQLDEVVCAAAAWSAASICRICSCGIRGEQCMCAGTAFASTGRNATACGSCTLPADCSAAAPS